ncbi:hypothetical protein PIROE2DRAFT_6072 [Piromyces sp. E2]|nr:hypothetical protein PIROE2DRAFT_6072 [Piromyces sp. E2]|eukprot:OUM66652.1 hypothetical protein PIROE2DRAFT_6072 [Piromyces sp. E2]
MDVIQQYIDFFINNFITDNDFFINNKKNPITSYSENPSNIIHLQKRSAKGTLGGIIAFVVIVIIMFSLIYCCTQCMKEKPKPNTVAPYPPSNDNQMIYTNNGGGYQSQVPYPSSSEQIPTSYGATNNQMIYSNSNSQIPYPSSTNQISSNNLSQINTTTTATPNGNLATTNNNSGSNPYLNGQYIQHCLNDNTPAKPNTFNQLFPEFSNNNKPNSTTSNNGTVTPVPQSYQSGQYSNQGYNQQGYSQNNYQGYPQDYQQGYQQQSYSQNYSQSYSQGYPQNYQQGYQYQQDYNQSVSGMPTPKDKSTILPNSDPVSPNSKTTLLPHRYYHHYHHSSSSSSNSSSSSSSSINNDQNSIGGNSNNSGGSNGGDSGGGDSGGGDSGGGGDD